jgi:hypothetical protein
MPKLALVRLAFNYVLQLLGMIAWGVGVIPFKMQAKLKCNENLAFMIQATRAKYLKVLGWNATRSLHQIIL